MKPIGQNIVIKTVDEEIRTSSGLLLSADIYYDKRAGYTMLINSESYTIISLSDVVVVL